MKKLIIANWKDHPETWGQAQELLARIEEHLRMIDHADRFELVICPPARYFSEVAPLLKEGALADITQLGAQDMTPEVLSVGARYVIIGHSDRRWKLGESDETVNAKLKTSLEQGLVPIVCLGERSRTGDWQGELASQAVATFRGMTPGQVSQCLIAYEPVWAISTNPDAVPDTPASAVQAMGVIRDTLVDQFDVSHPTFLYGGSVSPDNAADFLARPEISGVLVGGASVRSADFQKILTIVTTI